MKKKVFALLFAIVFCMGMLLTGCGSGSESEGTAEAEKTKLVIGTSSVCVDLANSGVEELEKMGYEVEIKVFDDYFLPNQALVEGELDANLYQHEPFLNMYNDEKGTDIMMLEPQLWGYWSGFYSTKCDSVETLPDGGLVGIAEDASNQDLDLRRMQEAGIIKLTDEEKELYDIADIVENPHGYEFITADHTKYKNMDEYSFITGSSNTMAADGIDPTENLIMRFDEEDLIHGMCILPENKDAQWVQDLMAAYTSDAAKANVPESAGFYANF